MNQIAVINNTIVTTYIANQLIDILLWSWIILIMISRLSCINYKNFKIFIKRYRSEDNHMSIRSLFLKHYISISNFILLLAGLIAVIQFSNQIYYHSIELPNKMLSRTIVWMLFHKLITISILIRFKNYQPKIFTEIKNEIKALFL